MAKAKTWICRAGVLFMLLLMLGTLISFVVEPIVSDARTRRALGDPDAYVTDTRRSPWISIDPEGRICLYPEKMIGKKTLVIPDAVNGVRVTGIDERFGLAGADTVETLVFPAGFTVAEGDDRAISEWKNLKTIVFSEGIEDISKLDIMNCPSLETVYYPATVKKLYHSVIHVDSCGSDVKVCYAGDEDGWNAIEGGTYHISKNFSVELNKSYSSAK